MPTRDNLICRRWLIPETVGGFPGTGVLIVLRADAAHVGRPLMPTPQRPDKPENQEVHPRWPTLTQAGRKHHRRPCLHGGCGVQQDQTHAPSSVRKLLARDQSVS